MAPKNRKKNVIGDDEYSMPDNEMDDVQLKNGMKEEPAGSVDAEPIQFTGKKKGKKGKKAVAAPDKDDENYSLEESEATVLHETSDNKKGKKGNKSVFSTLEEVFDDDVTTVAEEDDTDSIQFSGKKKGKKGKKAAAWSTDETESTGTAVDLNSNVEENYVEKDVDASLEQDGEDSIVFSGKKKGKKGKKSAGRSIGESESTDAAVDLDANIADADNDAEKKMETAIVDEETDTIQFVGKKKSKKGKKNSTVADINDLENVGDGMDESTVNAQSFPSAEELEQTVEQDSTGSLEFSGKKKGKKGKKNVQVSDFDDIEAIMAELDRPKGAQKDQAPREDAIDAVAVRNAGESEGKKKGKKGKKNDTGSEMDDIDSILAEFKAGSTPLEDMPTNIGTTQESSDLDVLQLGGKKKNKKGKKVAAPTDADDIDSILAELEAPKPKSAPDASAKKEPESLLSEDTSAIAETTESAAAKKKKKKKEKTKADKPEETKEEKDEPPKVKILDKKVPKHVREMQERLARMKEAEERLKREEEEKRRKEEEEQRRLEELERQKEEAKRRRKEREKEKLHQKKLEGKLLTGKQKEEARRLALMREQFLAQKGETDVLKEEVSGPRKPKYETKKKKKLPGADVNVEQADKGELAIELEAEVEHEHEPEPEPQQELSESKMDVEESEAAEQEEEEEEDWDAKSWDDENVILPVIKSAFAEEEEEEDEEKGRPAVTVGKSTKRVVAEPVPPAKRSASPMSKTTKGGPSKSPKNEESGSEEESDDESEDDTKTKPLLESRQRREARKAEALSKRSADDLRSPICCILGHVDTGKTKLLDCIRRTNVQEGEAGGITQQIGATYFPMENIQERTKELLISKPELELRLPGLLVIDTPGHESFTNLRARGSGLCDIAILVIDIMHGLEPQTIESLNLLKMRHTPFVVALNKVDRLYGWKACPNAPIEVAFKQQNRDVMAEFKTRMTQIVTQLKEQGLNSEVYYNNKDSRKFINIVPTSAITGEGVPDLLILLVQLTQKRMEDKLMYISEVQCTVLEVKVVEGLGTTIDVILINGVLHEGDQIVVCGMQGAIVTTIRSLLTPHPMKELRVKGSYQHHKELKAAQGIKITAQGLEHAVAGTQLYVVGPDDDLEDIKKEAMQDMKNVMNRVDRSGEGVYVQASTLGSLEALLEFLKSVKIPVSGIGIGPVHKKDIVRASVMLEKKKEYATILAFDVKVTPEAKELAEETGVKIFMADIIYHLFDQFTAYMNNIKEEKRKDASEEAVFPCVLKIFPQYVFNKKDPIVLGVEVLEGILKIGTPICVPSRDNIDIGKIQSIEMNHKVVDVAKKGQEAAIKIVGTNPEESQKMYGRHFEHEDELVSHITRRSIDLLKENYRDDLTAEEWRLVVKLKKLFEIQ